jgi:hypothetical protein
VKITFNCGASKALEILRRKMKALERYKKGLKALTRLLPTSVQIFAGLASIVARSYHVVA